MGKKGLGDIIDQVIETSWEILDYRSKLAMGKYAELPENYIDFDKKEQDNILKLVQPLLSTEQLTKKIAAETSQDIIKLIRLGKISLNDAKDLMQLVRNRAEVEEQEIRLDLQKKMLSMLNK